MIDSKNIDATIGHTIDQPIVTANDFSQFFATNLGHDLTGERKLTQPPHRFAQAANKCRRSRWSVASNVSTNRPQVVA